MEFLKNEFKIEITSDKTMVVNYIGPNPELDLIFHAFLGMLIDLGFTKEQIEQELNSRARK